MIVPVLAAVLIAVDGGAPVRSVPTWETLKISTTVSTKDYGETQVIADDSGNVNAVWMMSASAEIRRRRSTDGGATWLGTDTQLQTEAGDPIMVRHSSGRLYHSYMVGESSLLFNNSTRVHRSTDNGATWTLRGKVETGQTDRSGLAVDSAENLYSIYRLPASPSWPIWFEKSTDQGTTWTGKVEVTANRPTGTVGGFPGGVGVADDGRIIVGMRGVPSGGNHCAANAHGYVYSSTNGGTSFGTAKQYTTASSSIAHCTSTPIGFKPYNSIHVKGNNVYAVWVGTNASGGHSLYSAVWRAGQAGFDAPVVVASGALLSLSLPVVTVGPTGKMHVFWIGQRADGKYTLHYSSSSDTGATFSAPVQPSSTVVLDNLGADWIGDYTGATTNTNHVFVAYGMSAPNKGTWMTILRNGA